MSAKDNLRVIHTVDGATHTNLYGKARISSKDIGLISLTTGEIVMADPTRRFQIEDFTRKAFSRRVEPGIYPVTAYIAHSQRDQRLAFAEIRFSNQKPSSYIAAKSIYDTEKKRRGFCGYLVNDCRTGFMDAEVFRKVCALPRFSSSEDLIDFDDPEEDYSDKVPCKIGSAKDGTPTAAMFSVHNGVYYWYWGKDRKGNLCTLTADFFTYT